jgi:hypothetical protein
LGRGESGGRADKGSDDGRLHFGNRGVLFLCERIYVHTTRRQQCVRSQHKINRWISSS